MNRRAPGGSWSRNMNRSEPFNVGSIHISILLKSYYDEWQFGISVCILINWKRAALKLKYNWNSWQPRWDWKFQLNWNHFNLLKFCDRQRLSNLSGFISISFQFYWNISISISIYWNDFNFIEMISIKLKWKLKCFNKIEMQLK